MTVIPMRQRTPAWHEARRNGIGSSDSPVIAGVAPWGDVLTLFAEKRGLVDGTLEETDAMRWGIRLEEVVAEAYSERTGRTVRRVNAIQHHPRYAWLIASLDRRVVGEKRLVEIKTTRYASDKWGTEGTAEIPEHYLVQVQHQLAVTGFEVADVPVLIAGSDLRIYTVPRDEALIEALVEMDAEFWQHVTDGTPPDAVALAERGRKAIPLQPGELAADAALDNLLQTGHSARQAAKEAKEASEAIDEQVKALLADWTAARGTSVNATFRPNKDSTRTDWRLVAQAYRKLIDAYEHGQPTPDPSIELDTIESLFTITTPGARPLRYAPIQEDQS